MHFTIFLLLFFKQQFQSPWFCAVSISLVLCSFMTHVPFACNPPFIMMVVSEMSAPSFSSFAHCEGVCLLILIASQGQESSVFKHFSDIS